MKCGEENSVVAAIRAKLTEQRAKLRTYKSDGGNDTTYLEGVISGLEKAYDIARAGGDDPRFQQNRPTACILTLDPGEDGEETDSKPLRVRVAYDGNSVYLMPEGYGDPDSSDGYGTPVYLDYWNNKLQVCLYPDINASGGEPQLVPLDGAKESLRKEDGGSP